MNVVAGSRQGPQNSLEIALLGPLLCRVDSAWVPAPSRQCARLATVLAGWPGEVVDKDRIITAIWGDEPPATATNTLQVHVSQLRRFLGSRLVQATVGGYRLDIEASQTDVALFSDELHSAADLRRRNRYGSARDLLKTALSRWRGLPYAEVHDPDLIARRARLVELHEQAREDYLECQLELSRDAFALAATVADIKELVQRQPNRERAHALLIRALGAAGRVSEADTAYEVAVVSLGREGRSIAHPLLEAAHDQAMAQGPFLLPRAATSVTNVVHRPSVGTSIDDVARVARAALVHQDAELVTVVTTADRPVRRHLCSALAAALADDMMAGVVVLDGREASPDGLDQVIRTTSQSIAGLTGIGNLDELAVILDLVASPRTSGDASDPWEELPRPPRIIALATEPLGRLGEIVVNGADLG